MKYFLLLVQEGKDKMPAPVWEVVARAAAAPPPLPPPCLSVVLHEKFDCELSCFAPKKLSDMSYSPTRSHIFQSLALRNSATLLATAGENLPFPTPLLSACTQIGKNKIILPKEHNLASNGVFVGPVCLWNPAML